MSGGPTSPCGGFMPSCLGSVAGIHKMQLTRFDKALAWLVLGLMVGIALGALWVALLVRHS